jgi:hypothetical protein
MPWPSGWGARLSSGGVLPPASCQIAAAISSATRSRKAVSSTGRADGTAPAGVE